MSSFEDQIIESLWFIKSYTFKIADNIDRKADDLAGKIRYSLSNSTWLPDSAQPSPPSGPRLVATQVSDSRASLYTRLSHWARGYSWLIGIVVLGLSGSLSYTFLHRRHKSQKKRRARRAANGGRKEVVIIAGSSHDAITKSLSLDLERRGFIVFMIVSSMDDEQMVLNLGRRDIRPLNIDILDMEGAQASSERFMAYIFSPIQAFPGAAPHNLHLAGMVLVPDSHYPAGPIENISAADWSDMLNLRLLSPFMTSKLFVRLLREFQSRLLVLTPSIINSLTPPFHAPEAAAVAALNAFSATLRRELLPLGVSVCQIKLGTFDTSGVTGRNQLSASLNGASADILSWPTNIRGTYARSYAIQSASRTIKGSSLRELHYSVFDALTEKQLRKIVRVGSGSLIYDLVGRWAPDGLVLWMVSAGSRKYELDKCEAFSAETSGSEGSVEWEKL